MKYTICGIEITEEHAQEMPDQEERTPRFNLDEDPMLAVMLKPIMPGEE